MTISVMGSVQHSLIKGICNFNLNMARYDNLDDALGSIKPVYKKILTMSTNLATGGEGALVTTPIGAVEDDDLWCTHCMDDPAVAVCAFCGCRVRYMHIQ